MSGQAKNLPSPVAQCGRHGVARILPTSRQHDVRTSGSEPGRERSADPTRAARHDDGDTGDVEERIRVHDFASRGVEVCSWTLLYILYSGLCHREPAAAACPWATCARGPTHPYEGDDEMLQDARFGDSPGMPAGWFQIAWSRQIDPCGVVPLRYFEQDLVLYREASGRLQLVDAYCPHMGAHLGFGGCVDGMTIVCPFHGWRFDSEGANVEIPYSTRPNRSKALRHWEVVEVGDALVVAWYHPDGAASSWSAPSIPELGSHDYHDPYPHATRHYVGVEMHPEWSAENTVDFSHFRYVHQTPDFARITEVCAEGPTLRVELELPMKFFGRDGEEDRVQHTTNRTTSHGLGIVTAQFSGDRSLHIQAQTPVDQTHCDLFTTIAVARDETETLSESARRRIEMEFIQVERDLTIWEHRRMDPHPALALEEAKPHATFARWARQFYRDQPVSMPTTST